MNIDKCKGGGDGCYFHPIETNIVGVCHLCLYDRLFILANNNNNNNITLNHNNNSSSSLRTKIFSLPSSFNPFEFRHRKHSRNSDSDVSTSQEDSFISIKFENNGVGSWDKKGKASTKISTEQCFSGPQKSVVEHVKTRATLRWRKRIGHIFQVIKWKSHVGNKVEGVKVRKTSGWIRNLTKRRTKE